MLWKYIITNLDLFVLFIETNSLHTSTAQQTSDRQNYTESANTCETGLM